MSRGEGDLRQAADPSVTLVGSRAATSYGLELATNLGRDLASMGRAINGAPYGSAEPTHLGVHDLLGREAIAASRQRRPTPSPGSATAARALRPPGLFAVH